MTRKSKWRRNWTFCNDLSGREWIPDNTVPGKPGWYEDVPRRVYIGTPGPFLTITPTEGFPWFDLKMRSKDSVPRSTHVQLVLNRLPSNDQVDEHVQHFRWVPALVLALSAERQRTDYLDYEVDNEVQAMIDQRGIPSHHKKALQKALDAFNGFTMHGPKQRETECPSP